MISGRSASIYAYPKRQKVSRFFPVSSSTKSGGALNVKLSPLISAMTPVNREFVTNSSTAFTAVETGVRIILEKRSRSGAKFVAVQCEPEI
jgi:hypothetical protein